MLRYSGLGWLGIGFVLLTLACGTVEPIEPVVAPAERTQFALKETEDVRFTPVRVAAKDAVVDRSAFEVGPLGRDAFEGSPTVTDLVARDSIVLEKVKEQAGELFVEALCTGMAEILQSGNPSVVVDPAMWEQFLTDRVESRILDLGYQPVHAQVVSIAHNLVATEQLGGVNLTQARSYVEACLKAFQQVLGTTPTPARTAVRTPPPVRVAVGDPCVVGRWVGQKKTLTRLVDNVSTQLTGGGGAILTISSGGAASIEYGPSAPFAGTVNGRTVALQFRGTVGSVVHAYPPNRFVESIQSENATSQWYYHDQWQPTQASSSSPSTSYSCTATIFAESTPGYPPDVYKRA